MKHLIFLLVLFGYTTQAQTPTSILKSNLSPELNTCFINDLTIVAFKDYKGPPKKLNPKSMGEWTYLNFPLDISAAKLNTSFFETNIIAIKNNKIEWTKKIGLSNISSAPALSTDGNHIYTGEKVKDKPSVRIVKYNIDGEIIWQTQLDSLEYVHQVFADTSDFITILASFDVTKEVVSGDNFTFKDKYIYHTIYLKRSTGKVISKNQNLAPTYYCENSFSAPNLNCHSVHYFYKSDTLIYSRTDSLYMVRLSETELKGTKIIDVLNTDNYYLALVNILKSDKYKLIINRWSAANVLKHNIEIKLPSDVKIIKLTTNELGGFSLFYLNGFELGMIKWNENLKLIEENSRLAVQFFQVVSDVFIDSKGLIYLYYVNQNSPTRELLVIKL